MYYKHNNNIKYIDSIIKCIGFEPIHYTDIVLSFIVFNDFDSLFISTYC